MKCLTAFLFATIWLALTPAHADDAAVIRGEATDPATGRTLAYLLWGPSDGSGEVVPAAGNSVFEPVMAVPNGTFAPGPHPLIVLFHGTSGNYRSMAWLSSRLASRGYMVISANHPGHTSNEVTEASMMETWHQAEDGSFLITHLLGSAYAPLIDENRIIAMGFSLGGYSTLAIAGAVLRIEPLQAFCRETPHSPTCDLFGEELYGPLVESRVQERDLSDPRLRAAVALAPGFAPMLDEGSLAAIDIPVMVMAGAQDEMLPIAEQARTLIGSMPHMTYVERSALSHFGFLGLCTSDAVAILEEENATFLCDDPEGTHRAAEHDITVDLIDAFLRGAGAGPQ